MSNLDELKQVLNQQHEGDVQQLSVVFSDADRVIVEAPAGYGKTTTMISRIAFLFATDQIPNPKRILGLTFSVNAALKIKREVSEKLPELIKAQNNPTIIGEKAVITNYHGFCKGILKKYGYLLFNALKKDVNLFKAIGDNEIAKINELSKLFSAGTIDQINKFEASIKNGLYPNDDQIDFYCETISRNLLPLGYITHNAVIIFTIVLLTKYPEIRKFYQNYFSLVIVDEFQDTNCIAWAMLQLILSDKSKTLFLGDSLQRIYGFIGALPNIMTVAQQKYNMMPISLTKNYRFRNNSEMLKLDNVLRENANNSFNYHSADSNCAALPAFWGKTQEEEAKQIVDKICEKLARDSDLKVAILCRNRGYNATVIENELGNRNINYLYGMFSDEDQEYIDFHIKCQELFIDRFSKRKTISRFACDRFVESVCNEYKDSDSKIVDSLIALLKALFEKVATDYATISPEDKYILVLDTFENRQLKQAMEYINSNVVMTTVHGAKGLEWDYVFLPDVERWVFPGYYNCINCINNRTNFVKCRCYLPNSITPELINQLIDELSVFYVGITRARKQVYISASDVRYNNSGNLYESGFSCLSSLSGIQLTDGQVV